MRWELLELVHTEIYKHIYYSDMFKYKQNKLYSYVSYILFIGTQSTLIYKYAFSAGIHQTIITKAPDAAA